MLALNMKSIRKKRRSEPSEPGTTNDDVIVRVNEGTQALPETSEASSCTGDSLDLEVTIRGASTHQLQLAKFAKTMEFWCLLLIEKHEVSGSAWRHKTQSPSESHTLTETIIHKYMAPVYYYTGISLT
jgi:hypothetical protein